MPLKYRPLTPTDHDTVRELIYSLYREDPDGSPVNDEKIRATFVEFAAHPEKGTVLVIEQDDHIVGYAVLVYFWSNESGGNIVNIDELYVVKEHRGQGIGTAFIRHLVETKHNGAVALELQVTPGNTGARKLYERIGFQTVRNSILLMKV